MTPALRTLILLTIASASPLLTALHLWQMKEWRWDRYKEHLRQEGIFSPFGTLRPSIVGILFLLWLTLITFDVPLSTDTALLGSMSILALLSMLQIILKKQPKPVWTGKAMILATLSLIIMIGMGIIVYTFFDQKEWHYSTLIALPILPPIFVAVSIACFRPIDTFFKKRILRAAEKIRINHPHLIVIGITGSVGKTTTKELLAHILTPYGAIATPEHVNSEIGVARWFTQKISTEPADSKKIVIVEMGAYKKGEIANICTVVKPQFGILTYIGTQHLGLFGGIEEIKNAKSELLEALPQSGIAFVNSDSKHIQEVMNRIHCHTVAIGTDHRAMIQAIDIEETGAGVTFTIGMHRMALPLAGTHMITNALLAIVVAEKLGIERSIIREALRSFQGFDHTFARREERGITLLDNTFSASVESTMAAIEWARTQPHTEKTLIFSGILELGDEEERLHLLIAERAKTVFDHIILTQPNTVQYFSTLTSEKTELYSIETKRRSVGSLLVCMGRMPKKTIESLLPPVS